MYAVSKIGTLIGEIFDLESSETSIAHCLHGRELCFQCCLSRSKMPAVYENSKSSWAQATSHVGVYGNVALYKSFTM